MNKRTTGAIALCIATAGIGMSAMDFRAGRARLLVNRLYGFTAERAAHPVRFWTVTLFNIAVMAIFVVGGVLLVAAP